MTAERWKEVVGHITDSFTVHEHVTEPLPEEMGPGTLELIDFQSPAGRIKLEWITQPRILDKKTLGSKRMGSQAAVTYVYSEDEFVHKFNVYRYDVAEGTWQPVTTDGVDRLFA